MPASGWAKAAVIGGGIYGLRVLANLFSTCGRKCGILKLNTAGRRICMLKCKIGYTEQLMNEYKAELQSPNILDQQRDTISRQIFTLQNGLQKMRMNLAALQSKHPIAGVSQEPAETIRAI